MTLSPRFAVGAVCSEAQLTEMAPGGVAASSVIVLSAHSLESGRLIDGHRGGAVLVLVGGIRVVDGSALCSEAVRLGCGCKDCISKIQ
jgi:hypothetical protein